MTDIIARAVENLQCSPLNPRGPVMPHDSAVTELAESIREHGILQPLTCTTDGVVLIGHRRLAAAKLLGLTHVPTITRPVKNNQEVLLIQLTENLLRQDLSPLQEAMGYRALIQSGLARSEVARQVGVHQSRVGEHLLLLELDPLCQQLFGRRELPVSKWNVFCDAQCQEEARKYLEGITRATR